MPPPVITIRLIVCRYFQEWFFSQVNPMNTTCENSENPDTPLPPADSEEVKAATAVKETPARPKHKPERGPVKELPRWRVLLHNDDVNEFEFVIRTVFELTPLGIRESAQRTMEAHKRGLSLLLVTHRERAELYQDQFRSKHLKVTIEPEN